MSSPAVLDIDSLLLPIAEGNPAGEMPTPALMLKLEALRKEPIPGDQGTKDRPADWPEIIRLTTTALRTQGKDLNLVLRLLEAVVKRHGVVGLRDGLRLLFRLLHECPDRLLPPLEPPTDWSDWEGILRWFNTPGGGGRIPSALMRSPLIVGSREELTAEAWLRKERPPHCDEVLAELVGARIDAFRAAASDLKESWNVLEQLQELVRVKLPSDPPDYVSEESTGNLGQAIRRCQSVWREIAAAKGIGGEDAGVEAVMEETTPDGAATSPARAGGVSREALYRQVADIADALQKLEPHSPVPYLLKRCVKLGKLAFPELIADLMNESSPNRELVKSLGLSP